MDSLPTTINIGATFELLIFGMQLLYVFFAFLLTRQAALMHRSFTTKASPLFMAIANVHFFASFGVAFLSFLTIFK